MATILLAEDDADIRFLITFKLAQAGHQLRVFGDGLSALADAREHAPDLAILDFMMPGMSGLEVCRELRKDPATAHIPVIILTAMAAEADITAGFAAGADDYIVKPFSPRDFAIRVHAALARAQGSPPAPRDGTQPEPGAAGSGPDCRTGITVRVKGSARDDQDGRPASTG
ncbi:MAG: response regulator [Streptosporangiaceae bacterium]|jgi:DNA-binding response OmpR family regulator